MFKTFALSCSLVYIRSLCSIGGIDLLSFGAINDFKTDHQSFDVSEFEVSFAAMLSYSDCFASRIFCVVLFRKVLNFCQSCC